MAVQFVGEVLGVGGQKEARNGVKVRNFRVVVLDAFGKRVYFCELQGYAAGPYAWVEAIRFAVSA